MAERWFLEVDGIAGEATDAAHKDEIDIDSWSWGVTNTRPIGTGGGGGAGRATLHDFQFVARLSKASPSLFLSCATGRHIKAARLSGVRDVGKGNGIDFLEYKLRDVTVTAFEQGATAGERPVDQFSLRFSKIEFSYSAQGPSGKLEPPVSVDYDVKASKAGA